MLMEVRLEKDAEIVAGLTRITELAIAETQDRLLNGDVQIVQGEPMRVPMKGKDAAIVGAVAIDKSRLLLNQPTSISARSSDGMEEALPKQFEELAQRRRRHHAAMVNARTDSKSDLISGDGAIQRVRYVSSQGSHFSPVLPGDMGDTLYRRHR